MFIDNYYFLVNIKDYLFLEFDTTHIEQSLQLIILSIKVTKKVMEYPQTRTQKLSLNQAKMIFSATPTPPGGGGLLQPLLLISGMTPLDKNFCSKSVALTLKSW